MKIGITGGVGSGKSTVSRILESMGFKVFYSDFEAKKIIQFDLQVRKEITELLGQEAFVDGHYNVPYVSQCIFNDKELKKSLNEIVHPRVRNSFDTLVKQHSLVFNEAAIMFETGLYLQMDHTVLVVCPLELRIERTMKRDGLSREQVEMRIQNQWSDEEKRKLTTLVIQNDEETALIPQIQHVLKQLN